MIKTLTSLSFQPVCNIQPVCNVIFNKSSIESYSHKEVANVIKWLISSTFSPMLS